MLAARACVTRMRRAGKVMVVNTVKLIIIIVHIQRARDRTLMSYIRIIIIIHNNYVKLKIKITLGYEN